MSDRFTPHEQGLIKEFEDILEAYAADPGLCEGIAGACLFIVERERKAAVRDAQDAFFTAVGKAKHPYIGELRRLWIQSQPEA